MRLGDDGICAVQDIGTVDMEKLINSVWEKDKLKTYCTCRHYIKIYFQSAHAHKKNYEVRFKGGSVKILSEKSIVVTQGSKQNNDIYKMFFRERPTRTKET